MRTIALVGSLAGLLVVTGAYADPPPRLQQREQSFSIHLNGPVAEVTPLFCPVGEMEWAPSWKPRFIHPADDHQEEGAVFTALSADGRERLWLLTTYDPEQGRVDYVVILPGFTANQIKIRVHPDGDNRSTA